MSDDTPERFEPRWYDHDALLIMLGIFFIPILPVMLYLRYQRHGSPFPAGRPSVYESWECLLGREGAKAALGEKAAAFGHARGEGKSIGESLDEVKILQEKERAMTPKLQKHEFNDLERVIQRARYDLIQSQAFLLRCPKIKGNREAQKLVAKSTFKMIHEFDELAESLSHVLSTTKGTQYE